MNERMKKYTTRGMGTLLLIGLLLTASGLYAQSRWLEAELMLQSRHAWRGTILGDAPAIEPSATATFGRFSFNVWAALTPDNSYSELDLITSWQFNYFKLSLLDYYNPVADETNRFWELKEGESRHSVELTLDNFDVERHRLKWMVGTFVMGDRNEDTGRPLYSTYLELSYPFGLWQIEATPFVGGTPFSGYYATEACLINTGLTLGKELPLGKIFTIPLSLSAVYNPYTQNRFVTFAAGIAF